MFIKTNFMLNDYTLKARFYPVIIVFLPIFILGAFYSYEFKSLNHLWGSVTVIGVFTYLFSQLGRDQGKKKEPGLWASWGGAPSVQILRLRDHHIDKHTKDRYHKKLQDLCPVSMTINETIEFNNSEEADDVYKTWSKYLISQTRDKQKYSLLLKDNTSYGFRRNLWGLKSHGIILASILLISNYIILAYKSQNYNPLTLSTNFQYSSLALIVVILFWIFFVNRNWVKLVAFSYAERLCEATENL